MFLELRVRLTQFFEGKLSVQEVWWNTRQVSPNNTTQQNSQYINGFERMRLKIEMIYKWN
jgi:hypothetical protein